MRDNLIEVDFTKNKGKIKDKSLFSIIKNFLKNIFNSKDNPSKSDSKNKIINYSRDIS